MNLVNSVPVKIPDLIYFRDPPINTDNVTDRRSGGVATSIADKYRIWNPSLATLERRRLMTRSKI